LFDGVPSAYATLSNASIQMLSAKRQEFGSAVLMESTMRQRSNASANLDKEREGDESSLGLVARTLVRNDMRALSIFIFDFALYLFLIFLALAPLGYGINIAGSIAAGFIIGAIFTLGHDACHHALTTHPRLNIWLARIAFIPSAHAVSLWILGHNQIHHGFTNLKGRDYVWEPMSPAEYAAAHAWRRTFYRLCRGPIGGLPYYLIEMWWKKNFIPIAPEARRRWRHHIFDSAFAILSQVLVVVGVISLGRWLDPGKSIPLTVSLGWLLPFIVWNWLMGVIIYVHHTHPAIPWFNDRKKWSAAQVKTRGTVHVRLPQPLHILSNNIMEHNAHHLDPGIPFYHLATAQTQVRKLVEGIVFLKLGPRQYLDIVRQCKLFDFDRGCWIRFGEEMMTAGARPPATASLSDR
jgi:acyl-lipid omega-6 desaturase (Delta-12 desaturase)